VRGLKWLLRITINRFVSCRCTRRSALCGTTPRQRQLWSSTVAMIFRILLRALPQVCHKPAYVYPRLHIFGSSLPLCLHMFGGSSSCCCYLVVPLTTRMHLLLSSETGVGGCDAQVISAHARHACYEYTWGYLFLWRFIVLSQHHSTRPPGHTLGIAYEFRRQLFSTIRSPG